MDPAVRREFLDVRRRSHQQRMDRIHAANYDREWGAISPSHEASVRRLMSITRPRGIVLDAACGTGKYWPLVLVSGRSVVGVDQSLGMLRVAAAKHPDVRIARIALQDLAFRGAFDAVMCIDAMENVGPEDWPRVLAGLRHAARPGAHVYVTVELSSEEQMRRAYETARSAGHPVVPGEDYDGIGYHYYPTGEEVRERIRETDLERVDERDADEYRHLLLRRP